MPPLRNDPDFRKRGDSGGDAPRFVPGEQLGRCTSSGLGVGATKMRLGRPTQAAFY